MKKPISHAIVIGLVLFLLGAQALRAEPMKCSGEEKTCNTTCLKNGRAAPINCREICHVALQICMRTGCWDNGAGRYCGLMKQ